MTTPIIPLYKITNKEVITQQQNIIMCSLCEGILIDPLKCLLCKNLFCFDCLNLLKKRQHESNVDCLHNSTTDDIKETLQLLLKLNIINEHMISVSYKDLIESCYSKGKKYTTIKYRNGTYSGGVLNDRKEGYGVFTFDDGDRYEGYWKNDLKQRKGKLIDAKNGIYFIGEYHKGKKEGFGIYKYSEGAKYEGFWLDNKLYGQGKMVYNDNSYYQGFFENDKKEGIGTYYWNDFSYYEGKVSHK